MTVCTTGALGCLARLNEMDRKQAAIRALQAQFVLTDDEAKKMVDIVVSVYETGRGK